MVKPDGILTFQFFGNIKRLVNNVQYQGAAERPCTGPKGSKTLDLRSIHWPVILLRLYRDLVLMLGLTSSAR